MESDSKAADQNRKWAQVLRGFGTTYAGHVIFLSIMFLLLSLYKFWFIEPAPEGSWQASKTSHFVAIWMLLHCIFLCFTQLLYVLPLFFWAMHQQRYSLALGLTLGALSTYPSSWVVISALNWLSAKPS